ncbi:hypothetical protein ACQI4L_04975 [Mycolicibacterium litorale]|uniref:hypothetical protein n=1 Tax=Mycolicibacterium litorale TaxID=758802 RepID=UPI003CEECC8E
MSYQFDVITTDVADAVRHVGGLMFDRNRAGWRVRVVTDDTAHRRALAILGAYVESPGQHGNASREPARVVRAVALPIGELNSAAGISEIGSCVQLLLWGAGPDSGPARPRPPIRQHLSTAAQIFKTQALRDVGLDPRAGPYEDFWPGKSFSAAASSRSVPSVR